MRWPFWPVRGLLTLPARSWPSTAACPAESVSPDGFRGVIGRIMAVQSVGDFPVVGQTILIAVRQDGQRDGIKDQAGRRVGRVRHHNPVGPGAVRLDIEN